MTYEEYCKNYRRAPSEEGKKMYEEARETVANEIAELFDIVISKKEAARFLARLEKEAEP